MKKLIAFTVIAVSLTVNLHALAAQADGTEKWFFAVSGKEYQTPAIGQDGTIYTAGPAIGPMAGLNAVNPDGSLKWTFAGEALCGGFPCDFRESPPAVSADGTVYIAAETLFLAINPDGTLKWAFAPTGGQETFNRTDAGIGADATVYVNGISRFYAVNPDGTQKWAFVDAGTNYSSPAIGADGTVYVYNLSKLFAINPDGTKQWEYSEAIGSFVPVPASPAIGADGTIYVPYNTSFPDPARFLALNPDGTKKWGFTPTEGFVGHGVNTGAVTGEDGTIYVGGELDTIYAINPDGTQKAVFGGGSFAMSSYSPAIAADGTVYIARRFSGVDAINPDGSYKWIYAINPRGSPVIGTDGTVYLRDSGGLHAVNDSSGGPANSSWPMHGRDAQHTSRVPGLPEPPVIAYTTSGTSVTVTWAPVAGASGYRLSYAPYPYTGPETIGTIDVGSATSISADLWEGAAFNIALQAYNSAGSSEYSNIELFILD